MSRWSIRRSAILLLSAVLLGGCSGEGEPAGPDLPLAERFSEDFENASTLADLFPSDGTRWTNLQRTPASNVVELSTARSRSGDRSVRMVAAPSNDQGISKADLVLERFDLREGDRIWVEFWLWLSDSGDTRDVFLWDLEAPATCTDQTSCPAVGSGGICPSPGRRLYLGGNGGELTSDLGKWCRGRILRPGLETLLPERWTRIRIDMSLTADADGRFVVFQDDQLVLDERGITLPRADAIYTRMQIGLTANGSTVLPNELFIDDVEVWTGEPPAWALP